MRGVAIFENHFEPAVVIDVGEREGPAVFKEIQPDGAGSLGECAVVVVENSTLRAKPCQVLSERTNSLMAFQPCS